MERKQVTLDGFTPDEILALPDADINTLVLCGEPLVFRVGSAEILGRFWISEKSLVLELAQIEGGGEGVLPTLAVIAIRYAQQRGLTTLDWRVHALNCAKPNPKLRRVMERRGFTIVDVPGTGPCFHQIQSVPPKPA